MVSDESLAGAWLNSRRGRSALKRGIGRALLQASVRTFLAAVASECEPGEAARLPTRCTPVADLAWRALRSRPVERG